MFYQPTPKIPQPETVPGFDPAVAFGTTNHESQWALYTQLVQASWPERQEPCNPHLPSALAMLMDLKPRDVLEAQRVILAMSAYNTAIECYKRAHGSHGGDLPLDGFEKYIRLAVKLTRTHGEQLDSLDRSRGKGLRNVNIENANFQAIVGNVDVKARRKKAKAAEPAPAPALEAKPVQPLHLEPQGARVGSDERIKRYVR